MTSTWQPIAKTTPQYIDASGNPYSGAVLKSYLAGTTTNTNFATDSTGGTLVTSIALNSQGFPEVSGNTVIPHINVDYKISLYQNQADADANSSAIWSIDNLPANFDTNKVTIQGGTTARDLNIILKSSRNVKDFGAVLDGVTDDRAAANAYLTQLASEGGGQFKIPDSGILGISEKIILNSSNIDFVFEPNSRILPINSNGFILIEGAGQDPSSWFSLSANSASSTNTITTSSAITNAFAGSWLAIRSSKLLSGTNNKGSKVLIYRKITRIVGTTYEFDKPLKYDFNTSDSAEAGVASFYENLQFINPNLNKYDFNHTFSLGISLSQCSNVLFENSQIHGSKTRASASITGRSFIKLNDCQNNKVDGIKASSCGWYGVEVVGACDKINVINGEFSDTRHAQDVNHATALNSFEGEGNDITFENLTSLNSAEAGFSTHDVGRDVVFQNCKTYNSGLITPASGFYLRNIATRIYNCKSYYASLDGLYADDSALATFIDNFDAISSGRDGIRIDNYARVSGLNASSNASAGWRMGGGSITNVRTIDNDVYAGSVSYYADASTRSQNEKIVISNWDGPQSAVQGIGLRLETGSGVVPQRNVFLTGQNTLTGYGNALFSMTSGDNSKLPITDGNLITSYGDASNPSVWVRNFIKRYSYHYDKCR
jgi:hypothetical protein